MSSFSGERLLATVQFFNDQLITVSQFNFLWTEDVTVRLEFFQHSAVCRVVKPPVKLVLLVRTPTQHNRLYLLLPDSPLTPRGLDSIFFWGRIGLFIEIWG